MMHREAQIYNSIWLRKVGSVECVKNEVSMRQPALFVQLIRPPLIQPYRRYLNRVLYANHQPHKLIALIIWNCKAARIKYICLFIVNCCL